MDDDEITTVGRPLPRIARAKARDGRIVEVIWRDDHDAEVIDVTPALLSKRIFARLRSDDQLFRSLRVNEDGNALEWDDGAELSAIWLRDLSEGALANAEFRAAMELLGLSLDGMASRLGIARRLVADYRKDKPIPKHIALATRYLLEQRKAG